MIKKYKYKHRGYKVCLIIDKISPTIILDYKYTCIIKTKKGKYYRSGEYAKEVLKDKLLMKRMAADTTIDRYENK